MITSGSLPGFWRQLTKEEADRLRLVHALRLIGIGFQRNPRLRPHVLGLARVQFRYMLSPPPSPWGWTRVAVHDRAQWVEMPIWLAWLYRAWLNRWAPVAWLYDRGLLEGNEGDYYWQLRPRGWSRLRRLWS